MAGRGGGFAAARGANPLVTARVCAQHWERHHTRSVERKLDATMGASQRPSLQGTKQKTTSNDCRWARPDCHSQGGGTPIIHLVRCDRGPTQGARAGKDGRWLDLGRVAASGRAGDERRPEWAGRQALESD